MHSGLFFVPVLRCVCMSFLSHSLLIVIIRYLSFNTVKNNYRVELIFTIKQINYCTTYQISLILNFMVEFCTYPAAM